MKLEEGTEIPLEGAVFSVYDPEGKKVGSYSTGPDGTVTIPLTLEGHYTVTEEYPGPGITCSRRRPPSTPMWSTTRLPP
ncbi:MAG: prealbumin-like fold domain-containing protein [Flavonifractor plautii]